VHGNLYGRSLPKPNVADGSRFAFDEGAYGKDRPRAGEVKTVKFWHGFEAFLAKNGLKMAKKGPKLASSCY